MRPSSFLKRRQSYYAASHARQPFGFSVSPKIQMETYLNILLLLLQAIGTNMRLLCIKKILLFKMHIGEVFRLPCCYDQLIFYVQKQPPLRRLFLCIMHIFIVLYLHIFTVFTISVDILRFQIYHTFITFDATHKGGTLWKVQ